jgi:hypothetical protein
MESRGTIRAKNGRWAERARRLKLELFALYLAARHPKPSPVLAECRTRAHERIAAQGRSFWIAAVLWLVLAAAGIALYI